MACVLVLAHRFWSWPVKKVKWNDNARKFLRSLDDETKIEIGSLLMMLQSGELLSEPQSKPMKLIHSKAHELRLKDKNGATELFTF